MASLAFSTAGAQLEHSVCRWYSTVWRSTAQYSADVYRHVHTAVHNENNLGGMMPHVDTKEVFLIGQQGEQASNIFQL